MLDKKLTKKQANMIAKLHIYSFFYLSDGFESKELSYENNKIISDEIKQICEYNIDKLNTGTATNSYLCVKYILDKDKQWEFKIMTNGLKK